MVKENGLTAKCICQAVQKYKITAKMAEKMTIS